MALPGILIFPSLIAGMHFQDAKFADHEDRNESPPIKVGLILNVLERNGIADESRLPFFADHGKEFLNSILRLRILKKPFRYSRIMRQPGRVCRTPKNY